MDVQVTAQQRMKAKSVSRGLSRDLGRTCNPFVQDDCWSWLRCLSSEKQTCFKDKLVVLAEM